MLLSISGVTLGANQSVFGFSLELENLKVLAACRIPSGWSMTVDSPVGPTSGMDGGASGNVAALTAAELNLLHGLFIVRTWNGLAYQITGYLDVMYDNDMGDIRKVPLAAANFVLEDGDRCPPSAL